MYIWRVETQGSIKPIFMPFEIFIIQSNLSYPNVDYPKLLGYSKTMDSPDFFSYHLLQ